MGYMMLSARLSPGAQGGAGRAWSGPEGAVQWKVCVPESRQALPVVRVVPWENIRGSSPFEWRLSGGPGVDWGLRAVVEYVLGAQLCKPLFFMPLEKVCSYGAVVKYGVARNVFCVV